MSKENYYIENGYKILIEKFLVERGWCCSNNCQHCPFEPKYMKGNSVLREDVKKRLNEN